MNILGRFTSMVLLIILIIIYPLKSYAQSFTLVIDTTVKNRTNELVNQVCTDGKLSVNDYEKYTEFLLDTGAFYTVEIEISKVLSNTKENDLISNNSMNYIDTKYTYEIMEDLYSNGEIIIDQGDYLTVRLLKKADSLASKVQSIFSGFPKEDIYTNGGEVH